MAERLTPGRSPVNLIAPEKPALRKINAEPQEARMLMSFNTIEGHSMKRTLMTLAWGMLLAGSVTAQPYGMGPGMMDGSGGYGMGSNMMGRYGSDGYGMGPNMMWGGYGGNTLAKLKLSGEQRKQIARIEEEVRTAHWQLMGKMHQEGYHMHGSFGPGLLDEAAARKSFLSMQATQKEMFELSLGARKRIDAVLTPDQREQLRRD
jgi:Spy/CpxP family protein refolding chaperone